MRFMLAEELVFQQEALSAVSCLSKDLIMGLDLNRSHLFAEWITVGPLKMANIRFVCFMQIKMYAPVKLRNLFAFGAHATE
ncbi:hypothetical protein BpHYR1_031307 [Brachionus plicatilis]|uniref:Uncharacterized protein n=1 Tax=Brachionus plicatilis TaxID=10195 RepID=A0A3M7T6T8_BRAPC|nr:hypothetical protein BpHYR1_031307 [Brachionus plicatilis]